MMMMIYHHLHHHHHHYHHCATRLSRGWAKASACSASAYLAIARWYPSSNRLVLLSTVSAAFDVHIFYPLFLKRSRYSLSRSVINLFWPSFCILLRIFGVMISSHMISWLNIRMSSLGFCLMVLHISAYSIRCLSSPFSTIFLRFIVRTRVGDDFNDFSDLLITLATLEALCCIMFVMVSLVAPSSVVSRDGFSIRVGIRSYLFLFVRYLLLVASNVIKVFLHLPSSLHRLGFSISISSLLSSESCYS